VLKRARRLVVAVIGGTVLLVGVAMIVLPGPALVVIPLGLAILATEFVWARRLLERVREQVRRVAPQGSAGAGTRDGEDTSTSSKTP
jgi:tellurite resistance protein TerC